MAFHNVRLPEHIESGARGGPAFKTSVIILSSGAEQRNEEWTRARGQWDISYAIQTAADYRAVLAFFYARRGRLFGFRFKDYSDYKGTQEELGTGNGTNRVFPLVKNYTDMGGTYVRQITRPIANTVKVYVAGVSVPFSLSATGVVTINSGSTPQAGQKVTADFQFDVPVRFDMDEMSVALTWEDAGDIPDINLVELKEQR